MFNFSDPSLNPLKSSILIILEAFWVHQTLLDSPGTIVSNSHFGKRPTAWEITTFVSHVTTQRANPYWWNFPSLAVCPSPWLICGLLLLNQSRQIQRWVYQLWRMDFLWHMMCPHMSQYKLLYGEVWGLISLKGSMSSGMRHTCPRF